MSNTENRIVKLAMSYINDAKGENLYRSDRDILLNVAYEVLNTLLEENEDGRETDVCEDNR